MSGQWRVVVDGPWPVEGPDTVVTAPAAEHLIKLGWTAPTESETPE